MDVGNLKMRFKTHAIKGYAIDGSDRSNNKGKNLLMRPNYEVPLAPPKAKWHDATISSDLFWAKTKSRRSEPSSPQGGIPRFKYYPKSLSCILE